MYIIIVKKGFFIITIVFFLFSCVTTESSSPVITENTVESIEFLKFIELGISHAMRGEYDFAIVNFTDAITLNPDLIEAYILRGRALYASVAYITNVGENFRSTEASTRFDLTKQELDILDQAIADYSHVISIDPNNSIAYLERGSSYSYKFDNNEIIIELERAYSDYNIAINLDPNNAAAYTYRAYVYMRKNNLERAIDDYSKAIKLEPDNAVYYENRGFLYYENEDWDNSLEDYNIAIKLDPDNEGLYNMRGNVYHIKGDFNRAITDYETALRLDPDNTIIKDNLENTRRAWGR